MVWSYPAGQAKEYNEDIRCYGPSLELSFRVLLGREVIATYQAARDISFLLQWLVSVRKAGLLKIQYPSSLVLYLARDV